MNKLSAFIMCQKKVFQLAWKMKVYPLLVIPKKINQHWGAATVPFTCLLLNTRNLKRFNERRAIKYMRHEMRHHWQTIYHTRLWWWYATHHDVYLRYYHGVLNWPEEDARQFSYGRYALPKWKVSDLERWYQRGVI